MGSLKTLLVKVMVDCEWFAAVRLGWMQQRRDTVANTKKVRENKNECAKHGLNQTSWIPHSKPVAICHNGVVVASGGF